MTALKCQKHLQRFEQKKSKMKKIKFSFIMSILVSNLIFCQVNISECNKQLENFKIQIGNKSNAQIILVDNIKSKRIDNYLIKHNIEYQNINTLSHIKLDTKSENGIFDIYSIQFSEDTKRYLFIIENEKDSTKNLVFESNINFSKQTINLLSHEYLLAESDMSTERSKWGDCFGACLEAGMSAHGLMGQVILLTGAASVVCPPCGFVAATYVAVLAVGCAGGCNPTAP